MKIGNSASALESRAVERDHDSGENGVGGASSRAPEAAGPLRGLRNVECADAATDAVTKVQSVVRGHQARRRIRIKTLAGDVVHTRIHGDERLLERIGVSGITSRSPKTIDIVSIDPERYSSGLAGGERLYSLKRMIGEQIVGMLPDCEAREAKRHVFVNAGYFNLRRKALETAPEHAVIGDSVMPGKVLPASLPIPSEYEEDFVRVTLDDGSSFEAGPVLWDGENRFDKARLQYPKYQWNETGFKPGMLRHAEHPNTRSAVVFPRADSEAPGHQSTNAEKRTLAKQDRIRTFVATNTVNGRGENQNGLDLAEAAALATKLGSMNKSRSGLAVNLDGGGSSQLAVVAQTQGNFRTIELSVNQPNLPKPVAANFIAFSKKPDGDSR